MAMKPKLTALKKLVGKLAASAPRPGQGAGWLAEWRLNDWCQIVKEAINPPGGYAAALAVVAQKEARRLGRESDPQLRAALDALTQAVGRWLGPAGTADREKLNEAVDEAVLPVSEWVMNAWGVNRDDPDAWTDPPGGHPPRMTDFPPEWFPTDTSPAADGENPDDKAA